MINQDDAGNLAVLDLHIAQGGYKVEAGENPVATLNAVIQKIKDIFKY
jgi:hypothetical protein